MEDEAPPWRRLVCCLADESAFVVFTRAVLCKLGYGVLVREEVNRLPVELQDREIEAFIADETRLGEVPLDASDPIIVLTGPEGVREVDVRIFGAVRKPAGVHALYRLLQQALEELPRQTLRVNVSLAARVAASEGQEATWTAEIVSLSEAGCLARAAKPVPLGSALNLAFELPGHGEIEISAEAAYYQVAELGLVFSALPPGAREAMREFVHSRLVEL